MTISVCLDIGSAGIAYVKLKEDEALEIKSPLAKTMIIGSQK
jgi:hypothetical protein